MLFSIFSGGGDFLSNLVIFVMVALALIVSLSIHEFSHAWVANLLGDPTAKSLGRLTLDPRSHLDRTGTMLLLLVGFGWGRPVPFDPRYLKHPKRDAALISIAGPLSNILLATILAGIFHLIIGSGGVLSAALLFFVSLTIRYNLILAIFNLIPVHPLDGFKVVNGILPRELSYQWMELAPYGMWILLFMIFTGMTGRIIFPALDFGLRILGL